MSVSRSGSLKKLLTPNERLQVSIVRREEILPLQRLSFLDACTCCR